jgi:hypothetical protein
MQQYKVFHQELGAPPPPPQPGYGGTPPPPPPPGAAPSGGASQRAIWALVLGIASWVLGCSFLTGIPAWIMGKKEVREIDEGRSNPQGRTIANVGMWLGLINTVLSILGLLIAFVLFVIIGIGSLS